MLILTVDDDLDDLTILSDAIEEVDPKMKCLLAKDGKDALALLDDLIVLPDIIFLDINMPVMNGKEFLLRKNPKLKDIPVVVYSTTLQPEEISEFFKLGANEFLPKPNRFNQLVEDLRLVLNRYDRDNSRNYFS